MKLFYIKGETDDGDNVDLIVRAETAAEATDAWRTYYADWDLPEKPDSVKEIPVQGPAGAISWDLLT